MRLRFTKMHGLGNDFVMIDGVSQKIKLTPERVRKLADRNFGVGCDQVLVVEPPESGDSDFRYRIYNQDGGEVENCGNGARCFAIFVRECDLTQKKTIRVDTATGQLILHVGKNDNVTVDMGEPILEPQKVPFKAKKAANVYPLEVLNEAFEVGVVSMGNPHAVNTGGRCKKLCSGKVRAGA